MRGRLACRLQCVDGLRGGLAGVHLRANGSSCSTGVMAHGGWGSGTCTPQTPAAPAPGSSSTPHASHRALRARQEPDVGCGYELAARCWGLQCAPIRPGGGEAAPSLRSVAASVHASPGMRPSPGSDRPPTRPQFHVAATVRQRAHPRRREARDDTAYRTYRGLDCNP